MSIAITASPCERSTSRMPIIFANGRLLSDASARFFCSFVIAEISFILDRQPEQLLHRNFFPTCRQCKDLWVGVALEARHLYAESQHSLGAVDRIELLFHRHSDGLVIFDNDLTQRAVHGADDVANDTAFAPGFFEFGRLPDI